VDPAKAYDLTSRYVIRRRASGAAAATVNYEVGLLGRSLTLAARMGLISTKPYLARPRVRNARQGFIEPATMRAVLARLPQPIQDAALWAYVTGWRRAEVFGLTWGRVDLGAGVARLDPTGTKTEAGRMFPFGAHPTLRRMMERRALAPRGRYVFARSHGGPVVECDGPWKKACREVGLGPTLWHDMRRSAARNLVRAGVPEQVAMALMGHKTREIFRRYCIVREDDLTDAVRLLARVTSITKRGRRGHEEEEGPGGGRDGEEARREVVEEAP